MQMAKIIRLMRTNTKRNVDFIAIQESRSFGSAMADTIGHDKIPGIQRDVECQLGVVPSRHDRLKDREDLRVEDMPKERAAAKDNYGESSIPDLMDINNPYLLSMTSCIGIDLVVFQTLLILIWGL